MPVCHQQSPARISQLSSARSTLYVVVQGPGGRLYVVSEGVGGPVPGRLKDIVVDAVISFARPAHMHVHTYTHGAHNMLLHFHNTCYLICAERIKACASKTSRAAELDST